MRTLFIRYTGVAATQRITVSDDVARTVLDQVSDGSTVPVDIEDGCSRLVLRPSAVASVRSAEPRMESLRARIADRMFELGEPAYGRRLATLAKRADLGPLPLSVADALVEDGVVPADPVHRRVAARALQVEESWLEA